MASILQGRTPERGPAVDARSAPAGEHAPEGGGVAHSHLVSHGDGTHHIEHEDGSQTEHPHIGHALMHLASKHSEGMHHHTHSDGMGGGHTVHTAAHGEGPAHSEEHGPHEHENLESVKNGMDQFFGEEEQEGEGGGERDGEKTSEGKDYD